MVVLCALLTMILTIFLGFSRYACFGEKSVSYAAVIYRHGDRTPVAPYPLDPYKNESLWPVPFGQLTNTGKQQHYALGQWLGKRYKHLISKHYNSKDIRVKSTDVDRTLMSAQVNLAGMYPPEGDEQWSDSLLWQPIPVHTTPEHEDEVLAMKRVCPAYTEEKERYMCSPEYTERLSKYQGLMEYLSYHTGKKVADYMDIVDIYSTLNIESLYNFTLPSWTTSVYPEKMREPACHSFSVSAATPQMARLSIGPLFQEIVQSMNRVIDCKKEVKLAIYSGHDLTIGTILTALGVFDGNCPAYTATIMIELIEEKVIKAENGKDCNSCKQYYIRVSYRNTPEIVEPKVLYIPNCGTLCPLERFMKLYENLIKVDWEHECALKGTLPFMSLLLLLSASAALLMLYKMLTIRIPPPMSPESEDLAAVNWLSSSSGNELLRKQSEGGYNLVTTG